MGGQAINQRDEMTWLKRGVRYVAHGGQVVADLSTIEQILKVAIAIFRVFSGGLLGKHLE